MIFKAPLIEARLVRRYKRFLADVEFSDGQLATAHCPNTGSMLGCDLGGSPVWLSSSDNPKRKYSYTWEIVRVPSGAMVGINTGNSNRLVREGIENGTIGELQGYDSIRPEQPVDDGKSRLDFLLTRSQGDERCYIEVKNVTAAVEEGVAVFPDAVTQRGQKHLGTLQTLKQQGDSAVLMFCVQRNDVHEVRPADAIDPEYGRLLREAARSGVSILAYRADLDEREIRLTQRIPVSL